MNRIRRPGVAMAALLLVAGCSGGGSNAPLTPRTTTPVTGGGAPTGSSTAESVRVLVHIPGTQSAASIAQRAAVLRKYGGKQRDYVSASTNYVTVTTYQGPIPAPNPSGQPSTSPNPPSPYYNSITTDISNPNNDPKSSCTFDNGTTAPNGTGSRTCPVNISAPANNPNGSQTDPNNEDSFEFQTFQTNPVGASSPPPALAQGFAVKYIAPNTSNSISAILGGVIANFNFVPTVGPSFDIGLNATLTYYVSAYDAANNLILAGSASGDPYANPIEPSGIYTGPSPTGTATTALYTYIDGNTALDSTKNAVLYSSDYVSIAYTAPAAPPPISSNSLPQATLTGFTDPTYFPKVTSSTGGSVDPIVLSEAGTAGTGSSVKNAVAIFTNSANNTDASLSFSSAGQTADITPAEATANNQQSAPTFTAALSKTCPPDVTLTGTTTFSITIGTTAVGPSCTVTFTDNNKNPGTAVVTIASSAATSTIHILPDTILASEETSPSAPPVYAGYEFFSLTSPFSAPSITAINPYGTNLVGPLGPGTPDSSPPGGIAFYDNYLYQGIGSTILSYQFIAGAGLQSPTTVTLPTPSGGSTPIVGGVAVDVASGFVAVADNANGRVCGYTIPFSSNNDQPHVCFPVPGVPTGVAVDANSNYYIVLEPTVATPGEVYEGNPFKSPIKFNTFDLPIQSYSGTYPVGIAVDHQSEPSIFVAFGPNIYRYDANSAIGATNPTPSTYAAPYCAQFGGLGVLTGGSGNDFIAAACPGGGSTGIYAFTYSGSGGAVSPVGDGGPVANPSNTAYWVGF